jgi:hypothetical protein
VSRALQVLAGVKPAGAKPAGHEPETSAADAVREVMEIRRDLADAQSRLAGLYRRLRLTDIIGAVPASLLDDLERAKLPVRLYAVADARLDRVRGELVQVVARLDRSHVAVAVVGDPLTTPDPRGLAPTAAARAGSRLAAGRGCGRRGRHAPAR